MIRKKFNDDWMVMEAADNPMMEALRGNNGEVKKITLPHDAMIHEARTKDTPAQMQSGFYPGGKYTYIKKWDVPKEWENETVTLEFEGVYGETKVFINGDYAATNHYGYSNFYVEADSFLKYGEENVIKVNVNNTMQPNSRWYSGSGIYRNVNLLKASLLHIAIDGVKITTPEVDEKTAVIVVDAKIKNEFKGTRKIQIMTEITDVKGHKAAEDVMHACVYQFDEINVRQRIPVYNPQLWSPENPNLYECRIKILTDGQIMDEAKIRMGIRTLQMDPVNGLRINGKETKLRGACIHHDNGVIGTCTLERAEERRCEQLKAAGFNCIRSAHHPLSAAMLDACDRVGMLVIDELSDMWNVSKNVSDYSMFFDDQWEKDVEKMVLKDINHPCVILYCMGNEIPEAGAARSAAWNRKINNKIKALDDTRYTTNAINGLFAAGSRIREIMGDIMAKMSQNTDAVKKSGDGKEAKKEGGANQVNSMMSLMKGPIADAFAAHPIMTEIIEEFASSMDVAGFNYLTARHALEHDLHPNRMVLGAETFPTDIARLWDIVTRNPHVLGDMTWTGYDYLGEAGIGVFYYDGRENLRSNWPTSVAYIGDINIIGYRRPISYLREIVFGLRKKPYIAVQRVDRYGMQSSLSGWMHKDTIASWTWPGYENQPAVVDVYSDAEEVELFLNGVSKGRKAAGAGHEFTAVFEIQYKPGTLEAVAYRNGQAAEKMELITAGNVVGLNPQTDKTVLQADGADLAFIRVGLKDAAGRENLYDVREISVEIEGPATIQGYGSAQPETLCSYDDRTWKTYDGYVLAVIRAGKEAGEVKVTFKSAHMEPEVVVLQTVTEQKDVPFSFTINSEELFRNENILS